ncbi:MAG: nucleoside recognition domain-containing protein, partial [Methanosarcinales archaeon]
IKIVPIVTIGIFVANFLINTGIMKKLDKLIKPIASRANLSAISTLAVATCTFSSTAGFSMLSQGLNEKKVSEKEVIATTLISSFPSILSHLFTFFIPFVIPILGVITGTIYIFLRVVIALLKSIIGIILAKIWLKTKVMDAQDNANKRLANPNHYIVPTTPTYTQISTRLRLANLASLRFAKKSLKSTYKVLKRIVIVMVIALFVISILDKLGAFENFKNIFEPISNTFGFKSEIVIVSATEILDTRAGFIVAGDFLNKNILNTTDVLIALLLGNIISFSTRFVKHSLPLHVSLFGYKLGTKIVMINAITTLLIDVLFIAILIGLF